MDRPHPSDINSTRSNFAPGTLIDPKKKTYSTRVGSTFRDVCAHGRAVGVSTGSLRNSLFPHRRFFRGQPSPESDPHCTVLHRTSSYSRWLAQNIRPVVSLYKGPGDWVTENVILHSRECLLCRIMLFCTLDGRTNLFCTFEQKVKIQGGGAPRVHLLHRLLGTKI